MSSVVQTAQFDLGTWQTEHYCQRETTGYMRIQYLNKSPSVDTLIRPESGRKHFGL